MRRLEKSVVQTDDFSKRMERIKQYPLLHPIEFCEEHPPYRQFKGIGKSLNNH